ncbi:DUF2254 family protein [Streptomyces sp. NPDC051567]|uniref:DUF2254 family protein n=1 Tax=Streptomyces sp. NPDC051567 TaxID=3365660 RepID=UPI00379660BA
MPTPGKAAARTGTRGRPPKPLFRRPRREARRGLAQLLCALGGFGLGLLAAAVDGGPQVGTDRAVGLVFTIGFGVISLVSIIYSMLFLVVQFSASAFSPRLVLFRDAPIVRRTFAFAIGVFVFCVTAGLATGARETVSASLPLVAVLLALVALGFMRALQTRAFASIQLAHSLAAIAGRARRVTDVLYTEPYRAREPPPGPGPRSGPVVTVRWGHGPAVFQQVDVAALVTAAGKHDSVVVLRPAIGDTLFAGTVLAEIDGPLPERVLRAAVLTGRERAFAQDTELPFRLLADIALRALSPAVNDPATAAQALDHLEDLLIRLADRDLDARRVTDGQGAVRVVVTLPGWERLVRTALDDLMVSATGSPLVLARLRAALGRLLRACPGPRRPMIEARLRWVEARGREHHPLFWDPLPP